MIFFQVVATNRRIIEVENRITAPARSPRTLWKVSLVGECPWPERLLRPPNQQPENRRGAPEDHRRADGALEDEGQQGACKGRRDPAADGSPGREGAPRLDHRCGGRVPGPLPIALRVCPESV